MAALDWVPVKIGKVWFAQSPEGEQRPDEGLPSKAAALEFITNMDKEETSGKAGVLPPDMNKLNMPAPAAGMPGMPPAGAMPMPGGPMGGGAAGPNPLLEMMKRK
jgi:hypothetical protein